MRLFVAVVPPDDVLDRVEHVTSRLKAQVGAHAPPAWETSCSEATTGDITPLRSGHIRWQTRPQWHVTLRFIGEVDDPTPFQEALAEADPGAPLTARMGPEVTMLGRYVVCAPVTGVEALATRLEAAVTARGLPPELRPFRGHLTLARLPRQQPPPLDWFAGVPIETSWPVTEIALLRSRVNHGPTNYETLEAVPVTTGS